MQNIHQFEKRKKAIRGAVDRWAGQHRKKLVLVDKAFQTHVSKDDDEEVMDNLILKIAPVGDPKTVVAYPVSMVHLGDDPDKWVARLNLKVTHMLKSLRYRSGRAHEEGRQNLPAAP